MAKLIWQKATLLPLSSHVETHGEGKVLRGQ